jgi:hypothetical protein
MKVSRFPSSRSENASYARVMRVTNFSMNKIGVALTPVPAGGSRTDTMYWVEILPAGRYIVNKRENTERRVVHCSEASSGIKRARCRFILGLPGGTFSRWRRNCRYTCALAYCARRAAPELDLLLCLSNTPPMKVLKLKHCVVNFFSHFL